MKNIFAMIWVLIVLTISANAASLFNPAKKVQDIVEKPEHAPELPNPTETLPERIALYWENTTEPHPERIPWSDELISLLSKDFDLYDKASDFKEICPKYNSLGKNLKLKSLGEFMVGLAYYESSFKPTQESVDVGTKYDKGSWSVGLYQMSANDNSAKFVGASYEDLKKPIPNIRVAMEQMKRQMKNRNKFLLDKSDSMRYWAIILKNGKYQKIKEIAARVQKQVPACK